MMVAFKPKALKDDFPSFEMDFECHMNARWKKERKEFESQIDRLGVPLALPLDHDDDDEDCAQMPKLPIPDGSPVHFDHIRCRCVVNLDLV
jgi:hypothetical protein